MSITGERIKSLRDRLGISQSDLATKIGLNNSVLSRIESGKRPVRDDELNKLADYFDVPAAYLLGRSETTVENGNKQFPDFANPKDKRDFKKFLDQQEVMFDGVPLTEEDKARVLGYMEGMFWEAKKLNKRKKPTDSNE